MGAQELTLGAGGSCGLGYCVGGKSIFDRGRVMGDNGRERRLVRLS